MADGVLGMAGRSQYPPELPERAVRMVEEVRASYNSQWAAIEAVAAKLGIGCAETLRVWVRQAEIDTGQRAGLTSEEHAEIKRLKREVAELRRANEILKAGGMDSTPRRPREAGRARGDVCSRRLIPAVLRPRGRRAE
jgi:transposase